MSLHSDLLIQARALAKREPSRPKQASLRRAVSTAYYALFHLLVNEAAKMYSKDDTAVAALSRSYAHKTMSEVSKNISRGNLPQSLNPFKASHPFPPDGLKYVADAFVALQQARHEADYDLSRNFTRQEVLSLVDQAEKAFSDWKDIRQHDWARLYLGCFLLWESWNKSR